MCHELELFSFFLTLDLAVNQIKRLCHRNHNSETAREGLYERLEFCIFQSRHSITICISFALLTMSHMLLNFVESCLDVLDWNYFNSKHKK